MMMAPLGAAQLSTNVCLGEGKGNQSRFPVVYEFTSSCSSPSPPWYIPQYGASHFFPWQPFVKSPEKLHDIRWCCVVLLSGC
ncbi:hypothetical protein Y1Q_0012044 [Alligator mississippiensis]|uniref:Uncharacterized protein n=1 Tax=Alligator mississippiensis TaxID=8496 RepID=A0A151P5P5_ALLMI|nr:hypothetical protein Y1Q_0012044 [Alligator mississippiensis]